MSPAKTKIQGGDTLVFAIVIAVYMAVILCIGVVTSHKQGKGDIGSFMTSGGGIGVLPAIALVVGANVAGSGTVGTVQAGYTTGISAVWPQAVGAIGIFLGVWLGVTKFYRVMALDGAISLPEAVGKFFSPRVRSAIAVITAFSFVGLFAIQPTAIAAILAPAFGWDFNTVMWVGGIFCIVLACTGGLKSISDTNVVHTVVMCVSLTLASVLVVKKLGGGLENVNRVLPASYMDPLALGWGTVGAYLATTVGFALNALSLSPVFGCKNLKTAHRSLLISAVILTAFAFAITYIGMGGKAAGIDIAGADAIYAVTDLISPVLSAIVNVGVLAAILSTAPMLAMSAGSVISHDIYASLINKSATPKQEMLAAKIVIVVIGVFAIIIGTSIPSIMSGLMAAVQIVTVPSAIVFAAVVTGRIHENSAFWSILVSGAVSVVWYFMQSPFGIQPVWPSLAAAVVVIVPMMISSKGRVYENYEQYRDRLKYYEQAGKL